MAIESNLLITLLRIQDIFIVSGSKGHRNISSLGAPGKKIINKKIIDRSNDKK